MWTENFKIFQLDLEKAEEAEIKLPVSDGSLKKQKSSKKKSTSVLLTMPKPFTLWITRNCGKFLKRWEYQTTLSAFWEICMQVKKQWLEPDMKQQTGSKLGKEYIKAVLLPCLFNLYAEYIMRNAGLSEAQAEIKIAGKNINNFKYADDTTIMAESKKN